MKCLFIVVVILQAWNINACAGNYGYQTKTLRLLAERLRFHPDTADFSKGFAVAGEMLGKQVIAEAGTNDMITHIGLNLFPRELKSGDSIAKCGYELQPVLLRFLERYFLEMLTQDATTLVNRMADDKVYFRKGTINSVLDITPESSFSLISHSRFYEVSWQKDGAPFITVVFPKQAELIYGADFGELQTGIRNLIVASPATYEPQWHNKPLIETSDGLLKTESKGYVIDEVSDAVYVKRNGEELIPVFSDADEEKSAANLLLGALPDVNCLMAVEQAMYGFKTKSYTVSLAQWLGYCAANGLHLYFAVEEVRDDGIKAFVLAENSELHYNHVLSVVLPKGFGMAKQHVVKVRLNAFIPTHNVKELYQKYSTKKKTVKYE